MKRLLPISLILALAFSCVLIPLKTEKVEAGFAELFSPEALNKALQAVVIGLTVSTAFVINSTSQFWDSPEQINEKVLQKMPSIMLAVPQPVKEGFASAVHTKYTTGSDYIVPDDSLITWVNSYVMSQVVGAMIGGVYLEDTGQGVIPVSTYSYKAPIKDSTGIVKWDNEYRYYELDFGRIDPDYIAVFYAGNQLRSGFEASTQVKFYQSGNTDWNSTTNGIVTVNNLYTSYDYLSYRTYASKLSSNSYAVPWTDITRGNDALLKINDVLALSGVNMHILTQDQYFDLRQAYYGNNLKVAAGTTTAIPMVMTPTGTGEIDIAVPIPQVIENDEGVPVVAVPTTQSTTGEWDWTGELANPIDGTIVREGEIVNPPPTGGGQPPKPNFPWYAFLWHFFEFLWAILMYMLRLLAFITTLPLIDAIPIDNAGFTYVKNFKLSGIPIYDTVLALAGLGVSLSIYRSVRN